MRAAVLAVGETVILPHPPLPLACVSMSVGKGCQQNDSLAKPRPCSLISDGWMFVALAVGGGMLYLTGIRFWYYKHP